MIVERAGETKREAKVSEPPNSNVRTAIVLDGWTTNTTRTLL